MATAVTQHNFDSLVNQIMHGAIDMHVHFGPDVRPENLMLARRLDGLGTARDAEQAGMGAIVLKSHYWPTGALAQILQPLVTGTRIFGMVCLNYQDGDRINPFAAEVGAMLGCKIVMAPTTHVKSGPWGGVQPAKQASPNGQVFGVRPGQEGLQLTDDRGRLLSEVEETLDVAQQHHMVVATGHVGPPEDMALVEGAYRRGLRTILTHRRPDPDLLDAYGKMVRMGAVVEWVWNLLLLDPPDFKQMIEHARDLGLENCCMTTDGGQALKPPPSETFRMFAARLLFEGMQPDEVIVMGQKTPAEVLGLEMEASHEPEMVAQ